MTVAKMHSSQIFFAHDIANFEKSLPIRQNWGLTFSSLATMVKKMATSNLKESKMERIEAKIKVATLIANYADKRAKAALKADRVTDSILSDSYATADLAELDPNDYSASAAFIQRHRAHFSIQVRKPSELDVALHRIGQKAAALTREFTREQFIEDILSIVTEQPRLLSDIIGSLRGGMSAQYDIPSGRRWRNVNDHEVERILEDWGAHIKSRKHGAGTATYVSTAPFDTVEDRWGKTREVY